LYNELKDLYDEINIAIFAVTILLIISVILAMNMESEGLKNPETQSSLEVSFMVPKSEPNISNKLIDAGIEIKEVKTQKIGPKDKKSEIVKGRLIIPSELPGDVWGITSVTFDYPVDPFNAYARISDIEWDYDVYEGYLVDTRILRFLESLNVSHMVSGMNVGQRNQSARLYLRGINTPEIFGEAIKPFQALTIIGFGLNSKGS